jgi:hypothetical protein
MIRRSDHIIEELKLCMTVNKSLIEGNVGESYKVLAELRESIEQRKCLPSTDKLSRTRDLSGK